MLRAITGVLLALLVFVIPASAQDVKAAKKAAKYAFKSGDYNEAIKHYKVMLQAKPDDKKTHYNLGYSVRQANPDPEEMAAFYNSLKITKAKSLEVAAIAYKNEKREVLAVCLYEIIYKLSPKDEIMLGYLPEYYYDNQMWQKAAEAYGVKAKNIKYKQNFSYYYVGESEMKLEKYQNALDAYTIALKKTNRKEDPDNWEVMYYRVRRAKLEVKNEPVRKALMAKPLSVDIESLGEEVNSEQGDYFAAVTADESMLLFTSRRPGSYGSEDDEGQYPEDFWICNKDTAGNWTEPRNLGEPINSSSHEGIPALAADGQKIYFYMSGDQGDGNIYESTISGETWSEPAMTRFCSYEHWETQPTISSDGNKIFFISTRDKKDADNSDIFYATRKRSGKWSKAKKMSDVVNSKYRENSPFIHPDGKTLYFSSEGHGCVGGFDIFKTVYNVEEDTWSPPVNIGYPINTKENDYGFILNALGNRAYFHSNREGSLGRQDLFVAYLTGKPKPAPPVAAVVDQEEPEEVEMEKVEEAAPETVAATAVVTVTGTVTDEDTGEPIEANIQMQNLTTSDYVADMSSNSKSGKYLVVLPVGSNYGIAANAKGYLFHSENFDLPENAAAAIIKKDIKLKKVKVGKKIVLNNIFFESGKSELNTESTLELERMIAFMGKEKKLKIEISGHTDNVGSDASNQSLSLARAKSVVAYLSSNGIEGERLVAKGYGEAQPIATNNTDEGKALNRRTEFKIVGN